MQGAGRGRAGLCRTGGAAFSKSDQVVIEAIVRRLALRKAASPQAHLQSCHATARGAFSWRRCRVSRVNFALICTGKTARPCCTAPNGGTARRQFDASIWFPCAHLRNAFLQPSVCNASFSISLIAAGAYVPIAGRLADAAQTSCFDRPTKRLLCPLRRRPGIRACVEHDLHQFERTETACRRAFTWNLNGGRAV